MLSGLEGMPEMVGLKVMAAGVRAGTHLDSWRERVPENKSCNTKTSGTKPFKLKFEVFPYNSPPVPESRLPQTARQHIHLLCATVTWTTAPPPAAAAAAHLISHPPSLGLVVVALRCALTVTLQLNYK